MEITFSKSSGPWWLPHLCYQPYSEKLWTSANDGKAHRPINFHYVPHIVREYFDLDDGLCHALLYGGKLEWEQEKEEVLSLDGLSYGTISQTMDSDTKVSHKNWREEL